MSTKQQKIASHLLQIGAVKINAKNPYTWSSGLKSPIYCDNRLLLSYPAVRSEVRQAFVEVALNWHDFDVIGGVATAGIPHGALVADALEKPFIYVRAKAKGHGKKNKIEGYLESGARVILVEDLISTGGSSLKAAEAVKEAGATVVGVMAIFSYGFEIAAHAFDEASIPFRTLITLDDLLLAAKHGGLSSEDQEVVRSWRLNPIEWSNKITIN